MAARHQERPNEPTYTRLEDLGHLRPNENIDRANKPRLQQLCSLYGLSSSGTIESMRKDLRYYFALGWGGKPTKVTVVTLRKAQGPIAPSVTKNASVEDCFNISFDEDMWKHIVDETNAYENAKVRGMRWEKWPQKILTICRLEGLVMMKWWT